MKDILHFSQIENTFPSSAVIEDSKRDVSPIREGWIGKYSQVKEEEIKHLLEICAKWD